MAFPEEKKSYPPEKEGKTLPDYAGSRQARLGCQEYT